MFKHTITRPRRLARAMATMSLLTAIFAGLVTPAPPAEAATRAYQASATCTNVSGDRGRISVHHGVVSSGRRVEYASVAYTIQVWNGSRWRNYTTFSYVSTLYPSGTVELPPVHTVHGGYYYRVKLAVVWTQNGVNRSWAGTVKWYNDAYGRHADGWCIA
jgi:hypothetical protein